MIVNGTSRIKNSNLKNLFVTLTIDGEECQFSHACPKDLDDPGKQAHADLNKDMYHLHILFDMYPGAIIARFDGNTPLEECLHGSMMDVLMFPLGRAVKRW
jgi:hypothetical protein